MSNENRIADLTCVGLSGDYFYNEQYRSKDAVPYQFAVIIIDPSGRGQDETAYTIMKYYNGYLFICEQGGFEEGYSDFSITLMAQRAKLHNVKVVVTETNFGDGMYTKLIMPIFNKICPCEIVEMRNMVQKEARIIDSMEPVLMRHKLIIDQNVIMDDFQKYLVDQNKSFIYQMTRICKEKDALVHDDRLDTVAMGCQYFKDQLDIDSEDKTDIKQMTDAEFMNLVNRSAIAEFNIPDKGKSSGDVIQPMRKLRDI
jgi:hypothetical protein